MNDYIVSIKIETTGTDRLKDRIVQLSLTKLNIKEDASESLSWYVCPSGNDWSMSKGAEEHHHISKDFLKKNGVNFADIADKIIEFCDGCDLLTYSNFDWNFIQREFERVGKDFPFSNRHIYDAFAIEVALNSHSFKDVYKRYTGKDLEKEGDAEIASKAAIDVFKGQIDKYGEDAIDTISKTTTIQTCISPEQSVVLNDKGELIMQTGKHRGRDIIDVCMDDIQYIKWMVQQGIFTKPTKNAIARAWKRVKS